MKTSYKPSLQAMCKPSRKPLVSAKKTAERIALELKTELSQWRKLSSVQMATSAAVPLMAILEDVEIKV